MRPLPTTKLTARPRRAFTLAEVLAALALMAIIIPVAMRGISIATRAGTLGQRKATAMRIGERVVNELMVTSQTVPASSNGSVTEDGVAYPWTMQTETWPEDAMSVMTVKVTFTVQGSDYNVSISTLYDPTLTNNTTSS